MNAALDPATDRFRKLQEADDDAAELWRGKLTAFRNLYTFLSQIIPYQDSDIECLYTFLRHLAAKLPRRRSGPSTTLRTKFAWNTSRPTLATGLRLRVHCLGQWPGG